MDYFRYCVKVQGVQGQGVYSIDDHKECTEMNTESRDEREVVQMSVANMGVKLNASFSNSFHLKDS